MDELVALPGAVRDACAALPSLAGDAPVVLAASGGADSTAMVSVLLESGALAPARAVIAHFDHRLRNAAETARDLACGRSLCERYGLRIETGAWRTPQAGEAVAREARYAFLADVAMRVGARAVATGHTRDDQAETVVMRALRGAGLHGLAGITDDAPWPFRTQSNNLRVVRPLLDVPRAQTRAWCAMRGLDFADDATNDDRAHMRNRVRLDVLPRMEAISPGAARALAETAREARAAVAAIDHTIAETVECRVSEEGVTLDRRQLAQLPPELLPYAFRRALVLLLGDASDFDRRHYRQLCSIVCARSGLALTLPRGIVATVDHDAVTLSHGALVVPAVPASFEAPVPFTGIAGAWTIDARPSPGGSVLAPAHAVVRARRPGDRLQPRGMRGHKKLQDYYVDRHVPRRLRDAAPVIACGREVFWTPFGAAEPCADGTAIVVDAARL